MSSLEIMVLNFVVCCSERLISSHDLCLCLQVRAPDKMASFSVVRKKTPFQKHREEEDAKKKVHVKGFSQIFFFI